MYYCITVLQKREAAIGVVSPDRARGEKGKKGGCTRLYALLVL